MTGKPYTDADVEWAADAVARSLGYKSADDMSIYKWDLALDLEKVIPAVLNALAAAGRLLPAPTETTEQWAVRRSSVVDGEGVGLPYNNRTTAEEVRNRWLAHVDPRVKPTAALVRREVRRWPDGTVLIGPWETVKENP